MEHESAHHSPGRSGLPFYQLLSFATLFGSLPLQLNQKFFNVKACSRYTLASHCVTVPPGSLNHLSMSPFQVKTSMQKWGGHQHMETIVIRLVPKHPLHWNAFGHRYNLHQSP
ncbi:Protein of unknown function [Pyronema omphalodes CBS 100304]|uniref:Uncharacterized protein n=1 Tax=Pyronema omphalodes (strain CBS 100304) TaxID=1076935 RepID=U4LPS7_PYROM|nr:Protein of unknown function [Pyronema omphalodes CBS 100304]